MAKKKKENNETIMTKAALPSFLHHISFEFSRKKNYALNLRVKVFSTKYLVNWGHYFNVSYWRWDMILPFCLVIQATRRSSHLQKQYLHVEHLSGSGNRMPGPLTCHLIKCSMDWASPAVVCPLSLSFQTTYCSDSLIDRVFIKGRKEIVFLLCGSDESVHMFCEVSGSLYKYWYRWYKTWSILKFLYLPIFLG